MDILNHGSYNNWEKQEAKGKKDSAQDHQCHSFSRIEKSTLSHACLNIVPRRKCYGEITANNLKYWGYWFRNLQKAF